jgi:hypothetical protein
MPSRWFVPVDALQLGQARISSFKHAPLANRVVDLRFEI